MRENEIHKRNQETKTITKQKLSKILHITQPKD